VPVHRAADVEKQQDFDGVAALGTQLDVEIAVIGGRADRVVEIELLGRALAREAPEKSLNSRRSQILSALERRERSWPMRAPAGLSP
jgi:hypothetical protein